MSDSHAGELGGTAAVTARSRSIALSATALLAALSVAKIALHFGGITRYGFFRDELYYMACGEHLAWGYVDQPPLIAFVAWFARHVFGSSLVSIRLLPVLAGGAVVFCTGILARELGGGRLAQFFAAIAILFAPAYLAFDSFLSMNAFEPLLWLICGWIAIRIAKGDSPQLWLAFGAVAGVGLENKHTMLVFGFALIAGILLAGDARLLRSKWLWLGGAIALALFLPNLIWEARHGWPQIAVVRNAQQFKNLPISPLQFVGDQVIFMGALACPLWLGGLGWCFFSRSGRTFRFLAWSYLIVLAVFIGFHGKSYYLLPIYPFLMAAGAVAFEKITESRDRRSLRTVYATILILAGLITVPFGVPVLPVATFLRYSQALPYSMFAKTERDAIDVQLPQLYADMFGWQNVADTVADVYRSLPPAERANCGILAGNYGEAGAIDYYGPALGLPKALSGHNSYYDWGPRGYSGECMIIFGERSGEFIQLFGDVQQVATIHSRYAMPNERSVPVYLCRKPRAPLSALWPQFKMII